MTMPPAAERGPEQQAIQRDLQGVLETAVGALPESFRSVLVLREIEGLSTAETAECLGISEALVKTRLHLGCSAGSLEELEAELARLLALGATLAWEESFPPAVAARYRNLVLRDPEGNEFCLGGGRL